MMNKLNTIRGLNTISHDFLKTDVVLYSRKGPFSVNSYLFSSKLDPRALSALRMTGRALKLLTKAAKILEKSWSILWR